MKNGEETLVAVKAALPRLTTNQLKSVTARIIEIMEERSNDGFSKRLDEDVRVSGDRNA